MKKILNPAMLVLALGTLATSCQKKFDTGSYAPKLNIGGYTAAGEIAPSNLVAHWSFETNFNEMVSGNTGSVTGSTLSPGLKGVGMLNAGESYVVYNTPAAVQTLKSFTVAMWVKAELNVGATGIIDIINSNDFWGNMVVFYENGGTATMARLKMILAGKDIGPIDVNNIWGVWTHIAFTYDGATSTIKMFINGSNVASKVVTGLGNLNFQNASKVVLGTMQFQTTPTLTNHGKESWAGYLKGGLDEVRIYNRVLTANELSSLLILEGKGK